MTRPLRVACPVALLAGSLALAMACGSSGGASNASAKGGCAAGHLYCAACGGGGFCSSSCPAVACPVSDSGVTDAAASRTEGGGCPSTSPSYCPDCNGGGFCVPGACPATTCPTSTGPYPFPLPPAADAGGADPFGPIYAQCAGSTRRPLTASSYTDSTTGLTVHWPDGWTFATPPGNTFATLSTPITWVPTGSTTPIADQARLSISTAYYGNAGQPGQAIPGALSAASEAGGVGSALTLAGQPAAVWWNLSPVPEPGCSTCVGPPPSPELMNVAALVQFTMIDAGGGLGVEVDISGVARADAQPQQVFCDMEAMILGVTITP